MKRLTPLAYLLPLAAWLPAHSQEALYIDAGTRGHDINPGMYGIFFEEINHSGDGGLYPELIQNRGFDEHRLPGGFHAAGDNKIQTDRFVRYTDLVSNQLNWNWDYAAKKTSGWRVEAKGCSVSHDVLAPATPLHAATPDAMQLVVSGSGKDANVRLINSGYWGMAVTKGDNYDLRFHLLSENLSGPVTALVLSADGREVLASKSFDVKPGDKWTEYKAVLTPSASAGDAIFALQFENDGTVWVDYVSLFPQNTFMNRPNGLRPDIAQTLADLKPSFMRWPGGCIVEGIVLDNRVRWKETLGDPLTRPGQYDLWGYRSTWGMGYHEILQFCEDTGMDCMFVGNAGLSCIGWGGEYVSGDDLEPFYEDIRDAIEYALGDPGTNPWAAKRAEAGHPEPFPLKYVEIGNENFGERYDANYKYIYERLKKEYPQLTFLNTMGIDHAEQFGVRTDMIDPHWYVSPDYFYGNRRIFDDTPRGHYDIYVGEYAANVGVGQGNMDAALSEAVFMIDMERNSDIVKMASYAPLITNDHAPNWTCNLIWQHQGEVFGRASYYTQQMFAANVPDYNVPTALQTLRAGAPYNGRAGIGTWSTGADFRNFTVTDHAGNLLYAADRDANSSEWTDMQGTWSAADGIVTQSSRQTRCISLMNTLAFRDCVIEVEARKTGGDEGFLVVLGCNDNDWDHYYQLNIGGWGNTGIAFENVSNGGGAVISERPPFKVENDRWYKLKVVCRNGVVEGYVDGKLYCRHDFGTLPVGRVAAHAGYDARNGETVVKVVNAEDTPLPLSLVLNAKDIASTAKVQTLGAETLWDENSFSSPALIAPVESEISGVSDRLQYTFAPNSLTVVRIKSKPADKAMEMPAANFSCEPRKLENAVAEKGPRADLKRMIAEANAIAFDDIDGHEALLAVARNAADALNGDDATVATAVTELTDALNAYFKSLMDTERELTHLVANSHFEKGGDNSGWSGNLVVNEHVAEVFNSNFSVAQTVSGLEDGYYMVYAQAYYRNGGQEAANRAHADGTEQLHARFIVNDCEKPVVSVMAEVHDGYWWGAPNTMAEAHKLFGESPEHFANYQIAEARDGELRIAFLKQQTTDADWFCMDNVRLFRVPTSHTGVEMITEVMARFSPEAAILDMQGRRVGSLAGFNRLTPGIYIIYEKGKSSKIRI